MPRRERLENKRGCAPAFGAQPLPFNKALPARYSLASHQAAKPRGAFRLTQATERR